MTPSVIVSGREIRLEPKLAIGEGGEAVVYGIAGNRALKVYKSPDHPDVSGVSCLREAARMRLAVAQHKLPSFPRVPPLVVAPLELAHDPAKGTIVGFTMPLVAPADPLHRFAERSFRDRAFPARRVAAVLRSLHATLSALHASGVVVGDLNDVNVLVRDERAFLIDADSYAFGPFECSVFTERFVDPLLLDPATRSFAPGRRHHPGSDWYAFNALAMQSLLLVGPWGGTHRPRAGRPAVPAGQRPFRRLTVFDPEVRYPRPAYPPTTLPDALLHHFHAVFVRDERTVFPATLLDGLRFVTCSSCGIEHARSCCPICAPNATITPAAIVRSSADVVATRIFSTTGNIVFAASDANALRWLAVEGSCLRREDGTTIAEGAFGPSVRFGIAGAATLIGSAGKLATLLPGKPAETTNVDCPDAQPAFASNGRERCWVTAGRIWRDGPLGPVCIGDGLAAQTRIWLGDRLGLGLYRAGGLTVGFVFRPHHNGIRETLDLPRMAGSWLGVTAVLSNERAWLLVRTQEGGAIKRHCVVFGSDASVLATAESPDDGTLPADGSCAVGKTLLSPTDEGIVRYEVHAGAVARTREFPSTEPWVNAASRLLVSASGLHVIGPRAITRLKLDRSVP